MRIDKQRGPFKSIEIFLEEVSPDEICELRKRYSRVTILSHRPLSGIEGFRLRQKKTPNIYLKNGLESVLSGFRDTVRNEVHRTERLEGFEVRLSDRDMNATYPLYRSFEFAQGRAPITKTDFARFICASAYFNGRLISGITFFQSGDKIRIRSIFSLRLNVRGLEDRELYKIVGFASKRLIYEVCRYGIAHDAKLVDLASINLTDPEKEPIARFKSGFGAEIEDEYQYLWSSRIYTALERIVGWVSKLRAKIGF